MRYVDQTSSGPVTIFDATVRIRTYVAEVFVLNLTITTPSEVTDDTVWLNVAHSNALLHELPKATLSTIAKALLIEADAPADRTTYVAEHLANLMGP